MIRRILIFGFAGYYLLFICACTSTERVTLENGNIVGADNVKIIRVVMKSGEMVQFDRDGGRIVEQDRNARLHRVIVGLTTDDRVVELDPQDVIEVLAEKQEGNVAGTILVILGGAVLIGLGVLIYMYSQWNSR